MRKEKQMKRSFINDILNESSKFLQDNKFFLPPWAGWSPEKWKSEYRATCFIRSRGLGWDVTDFGSGSFNKEGLTLFTLRNGGESAESADYAEKVMIIAVDQVTPYHFHWKKQEDIINRGGGLLIIQPYMSTEQEKLDEKTVHVRINGIPSVVSAGEKISLHPGEYITLPPYLYHRFWAEKTSVLAGEVSSCNDDVSDNRFLIDKGRYPSVEEDASPRYLLVSDYSRFFEDIK